MGTIEELLMTDLSHRTVEGFMVAPDGDVDQVAGFENLRRALERRMNTARGSLVHRPDYGVGIKRFQNAINSLENQRALALEIREQFEQDSRVESFVGMRVTVDDNDSSKITIVVRVEIIGFGEADMQFVPFGEVVSG